MAGGKRVSVCSLSPRIFLCRLDTFPDIEVSLIAAQSGITAAIRFKVEGLTATAAMLD